LVEEIRRVAGQLKAAVKKTGSSAAAVQKEGWRHRIAYGSAAQGARKASLLGYRSVTRKIAGINREISARQDPSGVIDHLIQATASAKSYPAGKSERADPGSVLKQLSLGRRTGSDGPQAGDEAHRPTLPAWLKD
jgi:hypothetical protein